MAIRIAKAGPMEAAREAAKKLDRVMPDVGKLTELIEPKPERRPDEKLVLISVRVHEDDLAYFKGKGAGYQAEIRAALRDYVDRHRSDI